MNAQMIYQELVKLNEILKTQVVPLLENTVINTAKLVELQEKANEKDTNTEDN